MELDVMRIIIATVVTSVAWFILGVVLYMNPPVAKLYKKYEEKPSVRRWERMPVFMVSLFGVILVQCLMWAGIFALITPVLPGGTVAAGLVFGLILIATKNLPKCFDMFLQTTYPNPLLAVELVNGAIGSVVIGFLFSWLL